MLIKLGIVLVFFVLYVSFVYAETLCKPANVAGRFYTDNPKELDAQVDAFIDDAEVNLSQDVRIVAGLSPHAGYIYSGPVAGYFYKAVKGRDYDRVVVIGPSHFEPFYGVKVLESPCYKTPIGALDVDLDFTGKLIDAIVFADPSLSRNNQEHCLEVQLPFLLRALPDVPVVLILTGRMNLKQIEELSQWLYENAGNTLFIASTDMSHYHAYSEARDMDALGIDAVDKASYVEFLNGIAENRYEFCGYDAVAIVKRIASLFGADFKLLKYANSGDTAGPKDSVVGYMSGVFFVDKDKGVAMYSKEQRKTLLKIARDSIEHYLKTGSRLKVEVSDPALYKERGAFVTLKKNGQLRGCIGHIIGDSPLCEVVANMAVEAAVGDPRFPALTIEELPLVEIEISVLSPLKKLDDINDIKIGRDGLLLRRGHFSGLLLPQVPVEFGWDRMEFLRHLAVKAGLNPDMWQGSELYKFTAEVFDEAQAFGDEEEGEDK